MATFPARLVTPEQVLLEEEVQEVILRTDEGEAAFLPGHTPLIGSVVPGMVRFRRADETERRYEVSAGFVHVEPQGVVVLVPAAEPSSS